MILDDADDGCQEGGNVATRSDGGVSVSAPSHVATNGSANDGNGDLQRSVFGKKKPVAQNNFTLTVRRKLRFILYVYI